MGTDERKELAAWKDISSHILLEVEGKSYQFHDLLPNTRGSVVFWEWRVIEGLLLFSSSAPRPKELNSSVVMNLSAWLFLPLAMP